MTAPATFFIDSGENEDWPKRTPDTMRALLEKQRDLNDPSTPPAPAPEDAGSAMLAAASPQRFALRQLARLRSQLGTRLLAAGEQAYEAALRQAGARVKGRGRSRLSKQRGYQVSAAVDNHEPLRAWLSAVGITELEMLHGSFDAFADLARAEFARYWQRVDAVLGHAGVASSVRDRARVDEAVDYLVAGWTAMARKRLIVGDEALLASLAPRLGAAHRGFDLPSLPDDTALRVLGARLTRNALRVNEGAATMRLGAPDDLPEVFDEGSGRLEAVVARDAGLVDDEPLMPRFSSTRTAAPKPKPPPPKTSRVETKGGRARRVTHVEDAPPYWEWVHGYYGEPLTQPFEPHEDLDGWQFQYDNDEALLNDYAWPDVDFLHPGDHDGCTCEWVLV